MTWESLGLALIEASIVRPVVLVVAIVVILRVFRVRRWIHWVHPATLHAIWTAALVGMLLIPIVSVWSPHWNVPVLPEWKKADRQELPAAAVSSVSNSAISERAAEPVANTAPTSAVPESTPPIPKIDSPPALVPVSVPAKRQPIDAGTLVIGIYLAGLLVMLAYRAMGWMLLRRMLSRSGGPSRGLLRESGDVVIPVTAGILRPVVLLPSGWQEWDARLRRVVLAHEFEHIRRRDTLVSAFCRIMTSLLWFQPLAWWIVRKISESSEMVCDMAAAKAAETPAAYAQILVDFSARIRNTGHRAALPGLAIAGGSGLGRRVDRLLQSSVLPLRRMKRPVAILSLIGVPILCLAATLGVTGMSQPLRMEATFPLPPSPLQVMTRGQDSAPVQAPSFQTDMAALAGRLLDGLWIAVPLMRSPVLIAAVQQTAIAIPAPGAAASSIQVGLEYNGNLFDYRVFGDDNYRSPHSETIGLFPVQPDGSFEFPVVPQGPYTLRVFPASASDSRLKPIAGKYPNVRLDTINGLSTLSGLSTLLEPGFPVAVPSSDLSGVEVPFGLPVSAHIGMESGEALPALIADRLNFKVDGSDIFAKGISTAGTTVLPLGTHRISSDLPFGYYMKAYSYGTTDLLREPLTLALPAASEIIATITTTPPAYAANFVTIHGRVSGIPESLLKQISTTISKQDRSLTGNNVLDLLVVLPGFPGSNVATPPRGPLIVNLVAAGSGVFGYFPLRDDGTFEVRGVPPGTYSGYVTVSAGSENRYPLATTLVVGNANLEGVELPMSSNILPDKR